MEKESKVVMLPSEKASQLIKYIDGVSELQFREAAIGWTHSHGLHIEPQHLYLISDDEIKEGDWFFHIGVGKIFQAEKKELIYLKENKTTRKKVIASTDPDLRLPEHANGCMLDKCLGHPCDNSCKLPQIPESFIKAYVKANGIDEVMVEYKSFNSHHIGNERLKLTVSNEVVVSPIDYQPSRMAEAIFASNGFAKTANREMSNKRDKLPEIKAKDFLDKVGSVRIGTDKYFGYVTMQIALEKLFKELDNK